MIQKQLVNGPTKRYLTVIDSFDAGRKIQLCLREGRFITSHSAALADLLKCVGLSGTHSRSVHNVFSPSPTPLLSFCFSFFLFWLFLSSFCCFELITLLQCNCRNGAAVLMFVQGLKLRAQVFSQLYWGRGERMTSVTDEVSALRTPLRPFTMFCRHFFDFQRLIQIHAGYPKNLRLIVITGLLLHVRKDV